MMVLSLLDYQTDEFMEVVAGPAFNENGKLPKYTRSSIILSMAQ